MDAPIESTPGVKSRETLWQSEERLRLLVESFKDYAIFLLDPTGNIASWNPGAEHIKGYRLTFELFAQGDRSLARSEGGLGIGLTLARRLVDCTAVGSTRAVKARTAAPSSPCGCRSRPCPPLRHRT